MKLFKLVLSGLLTALVFFLLNNKLGSIPPLGKFLNPATGIWQNETDEKLTGTVKIEGLKDQVNVYYDAQLVPHIFAQNNYDLYKAQGYITAKHRLWQMEFQTHAAAGRLSEIIGEGALNYDREQRRIGMGYGAEQSLKAMEANPETAELIKAFAEGVNSYISSLDAHVYPVEYKLLDYAPEPWTTKKTAYLLMYMTKMLAGGDSDLEYTNLLRKLGNERFDKLFPDFYEDLDPIIPEDTDWSFIDEPITPTPQSEMPLDSISKTRNMPNPDNGSNNWAISGDLSYSGKPILANDPHLGLNLPSIWFVMQLATPEHNSFGATLPGALGVVSGFNQFCSWGETNATRDVIDYYKIKFNGDKSAYEHDGQWKKVEKRIEEIAVRGSETFLDTVYYTHHGPVTYDENFLSEDEKANYAMKWVGHLGGNNQLTLIKMNRAKGYDDYVDAIQHFVAPAQNFVFASTEGDIALWIQGQLPNKWKGQGKFLLDGTNPEHDWQGFIPQQFNAHVKNPERGFVSSANQHPVNEDYPFYVFNDGYETYRNQVINDFFRSKDKFNIQDFKDLHNNNYNMKAADLLPTMLIYLQDKELSEDEKAIYEQVKSWNFNNDLEEVGPSIWRRWWYILYNMIWDEFESEDEALDTPFAYQTIHLLKTDGENEFMDILETPERETATDLFLLSFKQAVTELNEWKAENGDYNWQNYKRTRAGHLLQGLPAFSRFDIPIGGDRNIVNATSETHGPSWRMIVEMTSPPTGLGIYPGGQSGNPGSQFYDNYIDDWAKGEYNSLLFMQKNEPSDKIIATQILN
ncbi:penicillin acylase family protein [Winogradskyella maritima]|uniref:Penicillin acylase family protein n=1 Tax=Winogradskyella maritima TaxID=1517766 RepID=A0ABV8AMT0_9FLAO|nr:penicillin acylase family protein [Winogradskyella maritima]